MSHKLTLIKPEPEIAHRTRLALAFETEIKRIVAESDSDVATVMHELSKAIGISESQLYNYRSGRTDIPGSSIRLFCTIFKSNALSDVTRCDEIDFDYDTGLDIAQLCNKHVRAMLEAGQDFLDVFEDGKVTGHEEIKLEKAAAVIQQRSYRLVETGRGLRRRSLNNTPLSAA